MSENTFNILQHKMDELVAFARNNLVIVGVATAILLAGAGGLYWYHLNAIQKEQEAHTILVDCLEQADEAAQGKVQWADVAAMCQAGYDKFASTKVAPYILAIQVDALIAQQKQQEALAALDLMLSRIGTGSPIYSLYQLKHALLTLDIPEKQEVGLHELEQLAADTHNIYNDAAQFYLGLYYRGHGQQQKAMQTWQSLIALNENVVDDAARSPWASLAQEKINGLA